MKEQFFRVKVYIILCLLWEAFQYFLFGRGIFSCGLGDMHLFADSAHISDEGKILEELNTTESQKHTDSRPNLEILFTPCTSEPPFANTNIGYISISTLLMKPKSFGTVRLSSKDPRARPRYNFNFLTDPDRADYAALRKGIRLAIRLGEHMKTLGYPIKPMFFPQDESDEKIDSYIEQHGSTNYHYTSTCRMGRLDEERPGVVDDKLKVHGIERLRVCDASVFPEIIAGHTMAPTVVVAEKFADILKDEFGATKSV